MRRPRPRGEDAERGSAVAEFVIISALVLGLFLSLLQLAVFLHARNMAHDAAAHAARYAALADVSVAEGERRAAEIARSAIGDGAHPRSSLTVTKVPEGERVTVSVDVAIPLLGLVTGPTSYSAQASAVRYR